jgi:cytoskeletal protein RodZ
VSSADGDRSQSRRKKRRGDKVLTPVMAGEILRGARESQGIDLAEVHDRTGISWRNLEALESGDLQRFSDPSAASVAMRRYAELVSLDPQPLVRSLAEAPLYAYSARAGSGANTGTGPIYSNGGTEAGLSGHLRRYVDDHSHLRSFTQTAQVPAVAGGGSGGIRPGAVVPVHSRSRRRRKAPWALRVLTWLVLLMVLAGAAGIAVDHYKQQWLRDIHVLKTAPQQSQGSHQGTAPTSTTAPTTPPTIPATNVATKKTGIGTATVTVGASDYTVFIQTFGTVWVRAQTPLNVNPVLNRTLTPGQTASIPVSGGQLSVELGSISAEVKIEVGGQTVQGWSLRPDAVPFFITFKSS